ncbi:hypothetical protein [Streptomyces sp. NPDC057582]|uniref:hypothetical protein n=1 Tax=Streptomyces sp. NPDC057582 TaxID=3346174 RepID=UPI0036C79312
MAHSAVFVATESEARQRRTVKADTLTAGSGHAVADAVSDAIRAVIARLIQSHEVDLDAYTGPIYFMLHGVRSEERARDLAAALHAVLRRPVAVVLDLRQALAPCAGLVGLGQLTADLLVQYLTRHSEVVVVRGLAIGTGSSSRCPRHRKWSGPA